MYRCLLYQAFRANRNGSGPAHTQTQRLATMHMKTQRFGKFRAWSAEEIMYLCLFHV